MGFAKCMSCIHGYSIIQNSFAAIKIVCAPNIHPSLQPLATTDLPGSFLIFFFLLTLYYEHFPGYYVLPKTWFYYIDVINIP